MEQGRKQLLFLNKFCKGTAAFQEESLKQQKAMKKRQVCTYSFQNGSVKVENTRFQ